MPYYAVYEKGCLVCQKANIDFFCCYPLKYSKILGSRITLRLTNAMKSFTCTNIFSTFCKSSVSSNMNKSKPNIPISIDIL